MQTNGAMGKLYALCDWITRLAWLNILWIVFSLAGLIVLGMMPATVAVFTVVRKWVMKETDVPVFRTFVHAYKKEFLQANILGLFMVVFALFLYLDYKLLQHIGGTAQFVLSIPIAMIAILYFVALLYLVPVFVQFELKFLQYMRNAFYIGILNLHVTVLIVAVLLALGFFFAYFPGLLPFFGVSTAALVIMRGASYSFRRIETKQKALNVQGES